MEPVPEQPVPPPPGVLLITGGARGIGAATARCAAAQGWQVAINFRQDQAAAEAVAEAVRQAGVQAMTVHADVADEAAVDAMFDAVARRFGRLDALVNNAGVVDRVGRVDALSAARVRRVFEVNVLGSMLCAAAAVRRMSRQHGGVGGSIVNVSSAAARLGAAGEYVHYAASKAAIDTFTLGLAREVAAEGIRVNAVRPGLIDTGIHATSGAPDRAHRLAASVPMQRPGRADEVAQAICWLLSPAASYVTGSCLDVTGGR